MELKLLLRTREAGHTRRKVINHEIKTRLYVLADLRAPFAIALKNFITVSIKG